MNPPHLVKRIVWGIRLSDFDIMMVQEVLWTAAFFLRGWCDALQNQRKAFLDQ